MIIIIIYIIMYNIKDIIYIIIFCIIIILKVYILERFFFCDPRLAPERMGHSLSIERSPTSSLSPSL